MAGPASRQTTLKSILLAHPLGNANVRQAILALDEADLLREFCTCLSWPRDSLLHRLLPSRLAQELKRRSFQEVTRARIATVEVVREIGRHLAARGGLRWLGRHEKGPFSIDAVFQAFDRGVAKRIERSRGIAAVYAYEDAASSTFRAAGDRGIFRFYDLPIGYWRAGQKIFAEEAERQPEWASTLTGRADSLEKLARKDEELGQADAILVASSFTRQTLLSAPAALMKTVPDVRVIPYGAPPPVENMAPANGGKLRVLFAGSLGQRKGLSYVLEALKRLGSRVELTLLGGKTAGGCAALDAAVRAHRWIPSLPHEGVLAEMARQDVLVFPSLFEGFGLVILEALSRGLPVIATRHTAAPDVLTDGVEGFLVPIRSSDAIAEKLDVLASDRNLLRAMKQAASTRAAALRWEDYRRNLVSIVTQHLQPA